jgi:hypothetical protein
MKNKIKTDQKLIEIRNWEHKQWRERREMRRKRYYLIKITGEIDSCFPQFTTISTIPFNCCVD